MSKLNVSVSTSCFRFIGLLFLFITFVSAKNVDDMLSYQYDNDDGELKNLLTQDSLQLLKNTNNRLDRSSMLIDDDLQPYGQVHIIPYKKRTIPIELQKALYAHGIVGRRRRSNDQID